MCVMLGRARFMQCAFPDGVTEGDITAPNYRKYLVAAFRAAPYHAAASANPEFLPMFGATSTPVAPKKLANISGYDTSSNQQGVAVPYFAGEAKLALSWITPFYNLTGKTVDSGGGKKVPSTAGSQKELVCRHRRRRLRLPGRRAGRRRSLRPGQRRGRVHRAARSQRRRALRRAHPRHLLPGSPRLLGHERSAARHSHSHPARRPARGRRLQPAQHFHLSALRS